MGRQTRSASTAAAASGSAGGPSSGPRDAPSEAPSRRQAASRAIRRVAAAPGCPEGGSAAPDADADAAAAPPPPAATNARASRSRSRSVTRAGSAAAAPPPAAAAEPPAEEEGQREGTPAAAGGAAVALARRRRQRQAATAAAAAISAAAVADDAEDQEARAAASGSDSSDVEITKEVASPLGPAAAAAAMAAARGLGLGRGKGDEDCIFVGSSEAEEDEAFENPPPKRFRRPADAAATASGSGGAAAAAPASKGKGKGKAAAAADPPNRDPFFIPRGRKGRGAAAGIDSDDDDGEGWCMDEEEAERALAEATFAASEAMEPPPELLMPLLPFQKQFLAWAVRQEKGRLRGGILADEMGMGKTIQAISLICTHRSDDQTFFEDTADATGGPSHASRRPSPGAAAARADSEPPPRVRIALPGAPAPAAPAAGPAAGAAAPAAGAATGADAGSTPLARAGTAASTALPSSDVAEPGPSAAKPPAARGGRRGAAAAGAAAAEVEGAADVDAPGPSSDQGAAAAPGASGRSGKPPRAPKQQQQSGKGSKAAEEVAAAAAEAAAAEAAAVVAEAPAGDEAMPQRAARRAAIEAAVGVEDGNDLEYCKATLVVCPVVAVIQWRGEIARYTEPGALKVVVYHGARRASTTREELESADVVLTTYSTIEADYRRTMMPPKITCEYCDKKYLPDSLHTHLRYFCGPFAQRTDAQARQQRKRDRDEAGGGGGGAGSDDEEEEEWESEDEEGGDDDDDCGKRRAPSRARSGSLGRAGSKGASGSRGGSMSRGGGSKGRGGGAASKAAGSSKASGSRGGGKGGQKRRRSIGATASDDDDDEDYEAEEESEAESEEEEEEVWEEWEDEEAEKGSKGGGPSSSKQGAAAAKGKKAAAAASGGKGSGGKGGDGKGGGGKGRFGGRRGPKVSMHRMKKEMAEGARKRDAVWEAADAMIRRAQSKGKSKAGADDKSLLHQVAWRRVVLDEAHCIKDKKSNTAKAVHDLEARYRWALSGTPLQNRVTELYSQIRFLRIFPFAHYFCSKCPCVTLGYAFTLSKTDCDHCPHGPYQHYSWWNRHVANPIKTHGYMGKGRTAMMVLKREVLPRMLLRRTKVQCADDLALPPRTLVLRRERFDEREADFYEALYTQSRAQFDAFVGAGTLLNNYAHIFDLLIRLRQAVCHPYLVVHSATASNYSAPDASGAGPSGGGGGAAARGAPTCADDGTCALCHDPREDEVAAACGHGFCRTCVVEFVETVGEAASCPACQKPLTVDLSRHPGYGGGGGGAVGAPGAGTSSVRVRKGGILSRIQRDAFQSSTKIEALRYELDRIAEQDPSAKVIVFSQFTSFLDLIHFRLEQVGIPCVKLEGSMSLDQRTKVIEAFSADPNVRVFLMSLKAGGVALNLTAANHVMLMDPWWNPAVEQQAQDRIHRLGQFKAMRVTRFVIGSTIEERILKLQEKKQLVFDGTVGGDMEALGRLTEDDLRFLFG